jgi:hypothetical protein
MGLLQLLLTSVTQPLDDPPQSGQVTAARAAQAALHQALQGAAHVALGQHVIGQGIEHVIGIERGQLLAAVPA